MIEFNGVSMRYKTNGAIALDNVNVKIEDGEFVFIVGASGAGKSSFLNVIMGQENVDAGSVTVGNYNLQRMKKKELPYLRRKLGIVFQDFRLIPKMTVYDNVAFALRVIGMGEKKITKRVLYVLKLVDLSDKKDCYPNQLSTGERQRVAIARSLVNNPDVIIADEPTGNLDPLLSNDIMSLFDKINALGATVVVVTHDLELVHQFDHRVVTIENGRIISDVPARYAVDVAPHRPAQVVAQTPATQKAENENADAETSAEYEESEAESAEENLITEETETQEVGENG